jgi:ABC-type multidrug transport system fused ATPase/permease subunit
VQLSGGQRRGRTTLLISHDLRLADLADEVLVLDSGRLTGRGAPGALPRRPGRHRAPVGAPG